MNCAARRTIVCLGACLLLPLVACDTLIRTNVATGLRDGTVTAVSGILEEALNRVFRLGDSGAEGDPSEEPGDDLFIKM